MEQIIEIKDCKYLSDYIKELPSGVLLNKGVTGCGGTTVELQSKRNSIILCPTKNLVSSKTDNTEYFGVDGKVTISDIKNYIDNKNITYKKIVATYDALEKLMKGINNYQEYFLLVDEYHLLFNDYSFRLKPIHFILENFRKFNNWCFMTATPLNEECILDELKDVPRLTYKWNNGIPVKIEIVETSKIQKELIKYINRYLSSSKNLHIFLNSITTIRSIIKNLNVDYRVVCSENSKNKVKNFSKVNSPIKKLNFYTSCAFEGCDIYDPDGLCLILCDTILSTTVLDISTKIRQICGRLRDSKYKDRCILILNTSKHRYAGITKEEFNIIVQEGIASGKERYKRALENDSIMKSEIKTFTFTKYSLIYLNKFIDDGEEVIKFDINLKNMDEYNYKLFSEIYNNKISVLSECINNYFTPTLEEPKKEEIIWIVEKLTPVKEYSYEELKNMFEDIFLEHNLIWNKKTSIKKYFPEFTKSRKMKNGKQDTYYKFNI